jgi:hypothetical protein
MRRAIAKYFLDWGKVNLLRAVAGNEPLGASC